MNKRHTTWVIIIVAIGTSTIPGFLMVELMPQLSFGTIAVQGPERRVALAVSGDDIYIAWITNKTGNDEVVFRSSNDAGASFNDKLNELLVVLQILSNTTNATLQDIQIAAGAENVVVIWWQMNATHDEPVVRISADNGQTFESVANLASNENINVIT